MNLKKLPKADLENKKSTFFLLGLIFALGSTLLAFEWTTKPKKVAEFGAVNLQGIEEEMIPITRDQEMVPPPPPPPIQVIEFLSIVDDDIKIDDDLRIEDSEADSQTIIDIAAAIAMVGTYEEDADEADIFTIVEYMPEFPGGELALRLFLANSIKYPIIAQENGIQGKVYVAFVVERDGSISNARIARGVDPSLDSEALRVIGTLPKWTPGRQGSKPVRVSYSVPINFVMN